MSDNTRLKEIYALVFNNSLESINKRIAKAHKEAQAQVEKASEILKEMDVQAVLNSEYTISRWIGQEIGMALTPHWDYDLNRYTAEISTPYQFYCRIRDSFYDFSTLENATVKGGKIKVSHSLSGENLIKEYANGNYDYELTPSLEERYKMFMEIKNYLAPRREW